MSEKMTDKAVRAELERIDSGLRLVFDRTLPVKDETLIDGAIWQKTLRLLAELHAGMGEIAESKPHNYEWDNKKCVECEGMIKIARKHLKGGSNG